MIWAKDVLNSCIIPKHSFILLLSAKTKLLTKDRLQHMEINNICMFYQVSIESVQHLFFQCGTSMEILEAEYRLVWDH